MIRCKEVDSNHNKYISSTLNVYNNYFLSFFWIFEKIHFFSFFFHKNYKNPKNIIDKEFNFKYFYINLEQNITKNSNLFMVFRIMSQINKIL